MTPSPCTQHAGAIRLPCTDSLSISLPLVLGAVPAGFPSPADDYLDDALDLNKHLIRNTAATFFMRVAGDSMTGAGIHDGDLLVIDRSIKPTPGAVVVATVDGEHTVKRLGKNRATGRLVLEPANPAFPIIPIDPDQDYEVWGVVTFCIHRV